MEKIETFGEECWVVGGCVRDSLMEKQPSDWDMTTSASPEKMLEIFSGERLILSGISHGTVAVIRPGGVYEITTYRIETGSSDHRHPDQVSFTKNIREDLSRRDFTVNAMAYHPERGLLDCFGGQKDIQRKIIRCVGGPQRRFEEDALRILRALRFASTLDFSLEDETILGAEEKAFLLKNISAERILTELTKLLNGKEPRRSLSLCPRVWGEILPELQNLPQDAEGISQLPEDAFLRLIWLYHREALGAADALQRLKAPRAQQDRAKSLFILDSETPSSAAELRHAMHRFGEDVTEDYILLTENKYLPQLKEARNGIWQISQLSIHGEDLMDKGFPKGKLLGDTLSYLLNLCMEDKALNNPCSLWEKAEEFRKKFLSKNQNN